MSVMPCWVALVKSAFFRRLGSHQHRLVALCCVLWAKFIMWTQGVTPFPECYKPTYRTIWVIFITFLTEHNNSEVKKWCCILWKIKQVCTKSGILFTIFIRYMVICGPGSVVGIATGFGLDGPVIESRWGARFSAPVQTCPGANPAYCTMGTCSFPGVKSVRGVTLTPHLLLEPLVMKE
jgi:hypothetical protein